VIYVMCRCLLAEYNEEKVDTSKEITDEGKGYSCIE
jgi:hypothetical protein